MVIQGWSGLGSIPIGLFAVRRSAVKSVILALLLALGWYACLSSMWPYVDSRESRRILVGSWLAVWIAVAGISSFQKRIPFTGKLCLVVLVVPLGTVSALYLLANELP